MTKSRWVVVALATLFVLVGGALWVHYEVRRESLQVMSQVSAMTYETLLKSYSRDGFTDSESRVLVGYLARSLARTVYSDATIRAVRIGNVQTSSQTFQSSDIEVYLQDGRNITIDFIVYEKDHTEITFHVSADGSGRLGHIVKGKIYTVSIEDGRWILRR